MNKHTFRLLAGATGESSVKGQAQYITPGTHTLVVPADVYFMSMAALQGGDGGSAVFGGDGGDLRYSIADISVSPMESLTIVVGAGGTGRTNTGSIRNPGAHTTVSRGGTVIFSSAFPLSAAVGGGNGGAGNAGHSHSSGLLYNGGGGGGAGGYSGNGGNGRVSVSILATSGAGGGGGGGGYSTDTGGLNLGFFGGGVSIKGQGTNGAGSLGASDGTPGSVGGTNGRGGRGGWVSSYADGSISETASGGAGGTGAFRAIWGAGRSYPSTNTDDV